MKAEDLIAKVPNLPVPSFSVIRLLDLCARPDADSHAVISIVKHDGMLSAKLLALCNSAIFGLAVPVGSIDQAVFYLGYGQLHRLIMAINFGAALSPTLPGYVIEDDGLWRHSLVTAYATEKVLQATSGVDLAPSVAFTTGLIHDIGKVVISHALNGHNQQLLRQIIARGEHSLVEAEREVLGVDHAEIGACLLRQWRLPDSIVEGVAHHHTPRAGVGAPLAAIVHVADIMAHEAGAAPGLGSFAIRMDETAIETLGLGPIEIQNLAVETFESLDAVKEMLTLT